MSVFYQSLLALFIYMCTWFVIATLKKRNDLADIAWGGGFVLLTAVAWLGDTRVTVHKLLVTCLVVLWAMRLSLAIAQRNRKRGEDFRYEAWRQAWGAGVVWRSFWQVFMLQGFFLFVIALPVHVLLTQSPATNWGLGSWVGLFIWVFGFFCESVADQQLYLFKKRKGSEGKLMTEGLWRFSRHPNYFGEVLQWWGIFIIVWSATHQAWLIVSPLTITWLILFVSGIPMLEKKYEGRADFETYRRKTSAFVLWWPKSDK